MTIYLSRLVLISYVMVNMIIASTYVGKMPTVCDVPYDWTVPFKIGVFLAIGAALGYICGRYDLHLVIDKTEEDEE